MFRKLKSFFIILLIMSLSFVPSVNASSDIFDDPVHVDYETYKERLVNYIQTPDFLKPSMPPIVGRNEYVDTNDILLGVDDLLSVMPVINNDSLNEIKKTSSFKNLNSIIVDKISKVPIVEELPIVGIEPYLIPYFEDPALAAQVSMYKSYQYVAQKMQDIIRDSLLLDLTDATNLAGDFTYVDYISPGGVRFTIKEFLERISSAYIMPDGSFHISDFTPLASHEIPPKSISAEAVAFYCDSYFAVCKPGEEAFLKMNEALIAAGRDPMSTNTIPMSFKNSENGRYPEFLTNKRSDKVRVIQNNPNSKDCVATNSMGLDADGNKAVLEYSRVKGNSESLGIFVNEDGVILGERLVDKEKPVDTFGYVESGVFFVLAIVSLVLACVYK